MSLLPDFHTRVLKRLQADLETHRTNLETCHPERHDQWVGKISATKAAISIVNAEFQRIGGEE
jgi:prephenate dehydrogenase